MAKILITSYYKDKSSVRQRELELCMKMNKQNKSIDKIYVFLEGKEEDFPTLRGEKITIVEGPRPTYKMFFEFANSISEPEDIIIIANTDIFYDNSLDICTAKMKPNDCYALSRYDLKEDGSIKLHHEKYSQDTWIFKGQIRIPHYCNFFLGMRGCDNRIAYEIRSVGYNIVNPAYSIISIHYHVSDLHNYTKDDLIPKPYLAVELIQLQ